MHTDKSHENTPKPPTTACFSLSIDKRSMVRSKYSDSNYTQDEKSR